MICDCSMDYAFLYDFVIREAYDFLAPQLVSQHTTIEEYTKKLVSIGTVAYEVDEKDRMCGFVIGYTHNTPPDRMSYITQVYVAAQYRGKKICEKLLREYLSFCQEAGLKGVWLTTGEDNLPALRVYERCGFVRKGYYQQKDRVLLSQEF